MYNPWCHAWLRGWLPLLSSQNSLHHNCGTWADIQYISLPEPKELDTPRGMCECICACACQFMCAQENQGQKQRAKCAPNGPTWVIAKSNILMAESFKGAHTVSSKYPIYVMPHAPAISIVSDNKSILSWLLPLNQEPIRHLSSAKRQIVLSGRDWADLGRRHSFAPMHLVKPWILKLSPK